MFCYVYAMLNFALFILLSCNYPWSLSTISSIVILIELVSVSVYDDLALLSNARHVNGDNLFSSVNQCAGQNQPAYAKQDRTPANDKCR